MHNAFIEIIPTLTWIWCPGKTSFFTCSKKQKVNLGFHFISKFGPKMALNWILYKPINRVHNFHIIVNISLATKCERMMASLWNSWPLVKFVDSFRGFRISQEMPWISSMKEKPLVFLWLELFNLSYSSVLEILHTFLFLSSNFPLFLHYLFLWIDT